VSKGGDVFAKLNQWIVILMTSFLMSASVSAALKKEPVPAYSKMCAYSVMQGDTHTMGSDQISVTYKDHTYYFSTEKSRDQFIENIRSNISRADQVWEARPVYDRR